MRTNRRLSLVFLLLAACAAGTGCSVGPDYERPDLADLTPPHYRWKRAEPSDTAEKGDWWKLANDPVLDALEAEAIAQNQDLRSAVARVDQARAIARISKSEFFPTLSIDPLYSRERTSGNLPTPIPVNVPAGHLSTYSLPLDLSYEIDLWGKVRRSFEAATAQAMASVSDYRNVLLTLTAEVAANYFQVRSLDGEIAMLERTTELRAEDLRVVLARLEAGRALAIDVEQARLELAHARADLASAQRERELAFDALALLCGKASAQFELPAGPPVGKPIVIPAGLPSSLLERRPDIAAAERRLAASNAQIGVAKAAYFPALSLTGQVGLLSSSASQLFTSDSVVWSITPSLSLPIFTGGRTAADVERAKATYEESLAQYKQVVLRAFKEVDDMLAEIALREREAAAQSEAVDSARKVTVLARARYDAGNSPYSEFVNAERAQLFQERLQIQVQYKRQAAGIGLVKALGGSWEEPREEIEAGTK